MRSRRDLKKKFIELRNHSSKTLYGDCSDTQLMLNSQAIYLLYEKGSVVYVGETGTNAMRRIVAHQSDKIFDNFSITEFHGTNQERKDLESILIKKYNPVYNKVHNKFAEYEEVELIVLLESFRELSKTNTMKKYVKEFEERNKLCKNLNYIINNYKKYTKAELQSFLRIYNYKEAITS